jgi:hypothetical protein
MDRKAKSADSVTSDPQRTWTNTTYHRQHCIPVLGVRLAVGSMMPRGAAQGGQLRHMPEPIRKLE